MITAQLHNSGINMRPVVLKGRSAEAIVGYADSNEVDLIIMATHGYSGVNRWVRGSVADRVLASSRVPVLLVKPRFDQPEE